MKIGEVKKPKGSLEGTHSCGLFVKGGNRGVNKSQDLVEIF